MGSRISPASEENVHQMLATIPDLNTGDSMLMSLAADGQLVELFARGESRPIFAASCAELWKAIQNVYFDENTEFVDIKNGAVKALPALLQKEQERRELQKKSERETEIADATGGQALDDATQRDVSLPQQGHATSPHHFDPTLISWHSPRETVDGCFSDEEASAIGQPPVGDTGPGAPTTPAPAATRVGEQARTSAGTQGGYPGGLTSEIGNCDLRLQIESISNLTQPEYRLGDFTVGLLKGKDKLLEQVYVEIQLGDVTRRSECQKASRQRASEEEPEAEFFEARFKNELMLFQIRAGELELNCRVFDRRHIQAAIRGDPLIGQGHLIFQTSSLNGHCLPMKVPMTTDKGESAGVLTLSLGLVRRPEAPKAPK